MKYLLLSFDLEEFDLPEEHGIKMSNEEKFKTSFDGAKIILDLLDKTDIKATFFTTASFAKKYPRMIKKISKKNEIALHGNIHNENYKKMGEAKILNSLKKAKGIIENIIDKKVYGFRSPRLTYVKRSILKKIGLTYDSSLHPTYIPHRYNNLLKSRSIKKIDDITVIPISVTPVFRLPFSWIFFRNLGLNYAKFCTTLCLFDKSFINIYFHPWEFIYLKKCFIKKIPYSVVNNTGKKTKLMLEKYIEWCKNKKLKPITFTEYLSRL